MKLISVFIINMNKYLKFFAVIFWLNMLSNIQNFKNTELIILNKN